MRCQSSKDCANPAAKNAALALNKIDAVARAQLLPLAEKLHDAKHFSSAYS